MQVRAIPASISPKLSSIAGWRGMMVRNRLQITAVISLVLIFAGPALPEDAAFRYPCYLLDAYDADPPLADCWKGGDAEGNWPVRVVPQEMLVGPPPSDVSCVTLPPDHWVELKFPGFLVDGPGDDIIITELGQCGEQALVFVTDGDGREYLLNRVTALDSGQQAQTVLGVDLAGVSFPFAPCAVRILGIDRKGSLPGFDVCSVRARTCVTCGQIACNPYPPDAAKDVPPDTVLTWSPAAYAEEHVVYFGTSITDVDANAMPVGNPPQPQDANRFDPGGLELGKNYYWRIDEANYADGNSPRAGDIWRFTVTDHIIVDDFDSYNGSDNKIYDTWKQTGEAFISLSTDPVYSCGQSMAVNYYYDDYFYSRVTRTFTPARNWASYGVSVLELLFYGWTGNETNGMIMYLEIGDGDVNTLIPYDGDPNNIKKESWQAWRIDLRNLPGVNISNITNISVGICLDPSRPSGYGSGKLYFDNIALYPRRCFAENRPVPDFTGDCAVDFEDLEEMAYNWLDSRHNVYTVTAPRAPLAWYKFDGNAQDSAGSAHGQLVGSPAYVPGVYGQAIRFDLPADSADDDCVTIPAAGELFSRISTQITIAFWQCGADSPHLNDTVCCSNYIYGAVDPVIAINLGCWRNPGKYNWDCGCPWSFDNRLSGTHRYKSQWSCRNGAAGWNHWAFVKNCDAGTDPNNKGIMQVFLNGVLLDSREDANSPICGITSFVIGSGWYGGYDGSIDDFRIYDYALSQPEVAYIATNGTGILDQPLMSPADLSSDGRINLKDFAILADNWLDEHLWP